jgi:hypothetical protein
MKNLLIAVGTICAAVAGFLILNPKPTPPLDELAHRLEDAWAGHHTVA